MIPKHEQTMAPARRLRNQSNRRGEEFAVSEVLGVIMMLAMVISIMGEFGYFLTLTFLILKTTQTGMQQMESQIVWKIE